MLLDASQAKSEEDFSGKSRPQAGMYHAVITHAEEKASKLKATPGVEVEFMILAGTTDGQENKTIPAFFSFVGETQEGTKACLDQVTRLALVSGILALGESKEVDWSDAVGREVVVKVVNRTYTDKSSGNEREGVQVDFCGFWSLGNKAVKDVPRDITSPGMQAMSEGLKSASPKPQAATAAAPTNAAPQPSAKKNFKDLL